MRGNERGVGQGASNYALQQRAAQPGGRAAALQGLRLVAFAALHRLAHRFNSGLDARGIGDGEQLHALVVRREEGGEPAYVIVLDNDPLQLCAEGNPRLPRGGDPD